jgi:hypothetical protein
MSLESSTGGRIILTKTGLIHYGNTDKLLTEPEVKKNGRPGKDDGVLTYDFSAFGNTKVPTWTGTRQVVRF